MSWKQKHSGLRDRTYNASGAKSLDAFDKRVERAAKGMTTEEALFVIAEKYRVGTSREFARLASDSQQRISNRIKNNYNTEINTTKSVKIDKRVFNIDGSTIQNLSIGDRTRVNQSVMSLSEELEELFQAINSSQKLSKDEKADYKSDLEALATQIGKNNPNKNIILAAWESIKGLATIDGFINVIGRIAPIVATLLVN
jgi:hypothetical protein